jgi:hypothetical protein
MIRSKKMSVESEAKILGFVDSKLSKAQVFASGDQAERIYGFPDEHSTSKTVDTEKLTRTTPETSPEL